MNRRNFVRTSAGMLAAAAMPGVWSCGAKVSKAKSYRFAPYEGGGGMAPVTRVTPDDGFYVHTYYDTNPFSPSDRYLATTRIPYQDHNAVPGDLADVCVIDLQEQTIATVHRTRIWGYQTGANLNWGGTDRYLYTNDSVDGRAACARIDLESGEVKLFAGPQYSVAPDDSAVIGFNLELMDATQLGYGSPSQDNDNPPRLPPGAAADEGLWRTDLKTNKKELLVSLADFAAKVKEPPPAKDGTWYLWHSKFNPKGRILQIVRCMFPGSPARHTTVFTMTGDGKELALLPTKSLWGFEGGHPNWHGDDEHVIRNINVGGESRLCQWRYDGSDFQVLSEKLKVGGHPRIEPSGRFVVTDSFPVENDRQMVRIRFLDVKAGVDENLCTMPTIEKRNQHTEKEKVLRLDGHPNWDRAFRRVIFQGAPEGRRQLFVADMAKAVS